MILKTARSYPTIQRIFIRYKHKPDHWSVIRKKIHPVDKALEHFNDFYKQVFGPKWPDIRSGLLGKQKYIAVVNNFGDVEKTVSMLENNGALNIRTLFQLQKQRLEENFDKNNLFKKILKEKPIQTQKKENQEPAESEFIAPQSLKDSLAQAELDERRLVDTGNALQSEILYEFVPTSKLKGRDDYIPESSHYKLYDTSSNFAINVEREYDIHFPEHLKLYCYEYDNMSDFPKPFLCSTGVFSYYLMDGGSTLPVIALDIKPGNRILDVCAAPGGKSLLALQTLYPQLVVSNDVSKSRLNRITKVYKQFLYDFEERWLKTGKIKLINYDARNLFDGDFDRILVDVPCTTDRHSLLENENNIFNPSRIKERLKLPEVQAEILEEALKLVKVGGIVVYSTCSLSPIQNDGVVHMALKNAWEEHKIEFVIKDLSVALWQTKDVFEIAEKKLLRYGHLVLPHVSQNYGPTYFCKMQRIS